MFIEQLTFSAGLVFICTEQNGKYIRETQSTHFQLSVNDAQACLPQFPRCIPSLSLISLPAFLSRTPHIPTVLLKSRGGICMVISAYQLRTLNLTNAPDLNFS